MTKTCRGYEEWLYRARNGRLQNESGNQRGQFNKNPPNLKIEEIMSYKILFEEHEELLGLFAKLKELRTKEEQAESVELQEHATKVMSTLDEGIKELDDLDTFFSFLTQIGQSHRKIPGFKPDYFWGKKKAVSCACNA
uniref:GLOBIN domain-containing protein n=1 Tax=Rhodnius prolixus TaxID=13249 RepID=T1HNJ1_RHOPR